MNNPAYVPGDMFVDGNLYCKGFTPPVNSINKASIPPGEGVEYTKLEHNHRATLAQAAGTGCTALTQAIAVIIGATGGSLNVKAGCITPCVGADTISIDVKKNGTTIMSGAISLTSAQAAYAQVTGVITVTGLLAGDVITVEIAPSHTSGTLGQGVFVAFNWKEDAQ